MAYNRIALSKESRSGLKERPDFCSLDFLRFAPVFLAASSLITASSRSNCGCAHDVLTVCASCPGPETLVFVHSTWALHDPPTPQLCRPQPTNLSSR
jgi:hypothetical protein